MHGSQVREYTLFLFAWRRIRCASDGSRNLVPLDEPHDLQALVRSIQLAPCLRPNFSVVTYLARKGVFWVVREYVDR